MAKEFAAVPIIVGAAYRAVRDQWHDASRLALGSVVVLSVWAGWQLFARNVLGYTTGPTYSADLTTGGFLVFWLLTLSPTLVAVLMAMVLGGLWLLWPAGLLWGPRRASSADIRVGAGDPDLQCAAAAGSRAVEFRVCPDAGRGHRPGPGAAGDGVDVRGRAGRAQRAIWRATGAGAAGALFVRRRRDSRGRDSGPCPRGDAGTLRGVITE